MKDVDDAIHNPDAFRIEAKHGLAPREKVVFQPRGHSPLNPRLQALEHGSAEIPRYPIASPVVWDVQHERDGCGPCERVRPPLGLQELDEGLRGCVGKDAGDQEVHVLRRKPRKRGVLPEGKERWLSQSPQEADDDRHRYQYDYAELRQVAKLGVLARPHRLSTESLQPEGHSNLGAEERG